MVGSASAIAVVVLFPEGVLAIDLCVLPAISGLGFEDVALLHRNTLLGDKTVLGRQYMQMHLG